MKSAVIFSELMKGAPCYCWRWRSHSGETESTQSFVYYLHCLADARANGYDVRTEAAAGAPPPGRGRQSSIIRVSMPHGLRLSAGQSPVATAKTTHNAAESTRHPPALLMRRSVSASRQGLAT